MTELEKARRKFLDECDIVVRSPAVWFIEGDNYSFLCTVYPIPVYVYLGIKKKSRTKEIKIHFRNKNIQIFNLSLRQAPKMLDLDHVTASYLSEKLLDLKTIRFVKENIEKKFTLPDNWLQLFCLDKISRTNKELGNFKLKIWSELPLDWPHWGAIVDTAFSTIMHCLSNNISPAEFDSLKHKYKQKLFWKHVIQTNENNNSISYNISEILKRKRVLKTFSKRNPQLNLINEIFTTCLFLSYGQNGAASFCSLLGDTIGRHNLLDSFGISYEIPKLKGFEKDESLCKLTNGDILETKSDDPSFLLYLTEIIRKKRLSVGVYDTLSNDTNILLINWGDKDRGLVGPILSPLFFEKFPNDIHAEWIGFNDHPRRWRTTAYFSYKNDFIQILGPKHALKRIEEEILTQNYRSTIFYNSITMGWEDVGSKLLEPADYKDIHKRGKGFEIYFGLEKTIEGNIEPIIKIDDKPLNMNRCPERAFTKLLYLAARKYKRKGGWVKYEFLHLYEGEQGLKDMLNCFGDKWFQCVEKDVRKKEIRLSTNKINIDISLKNFISEHWQGLVRQIGYLKNISDKQHQENEIIDFLKNQIYQSAIRNTFYVKEALNAINRRYQSAQGRKYWYQILNEIRGMVELINKSGLGASLKGDANLTNFLHIIKYELEQTK